MTTLASPSESQQPKIQHLPEIEVRRIKTERLETKVLFAGSDQNPPLIFLHGNVTTATIWEELMLELADDFWCVAPDLRGYGQADSTKLIDATNGPEDWVLDLDALTTHLEITNFHLVGHSMGGFIGWRALSYMPERISSATLIAPGPPYGFGGTHGRTGIPNNEHFSGSGAGIVNPQLVDRIYAGDRSMEDPLFSPRAVLNRMFWKEGFQPPREEDLLTSMLQVHQGPRQYPGDFTEVSEWPGVAPGVWGTANALSPKYNQELVPDLLDIQPKPPLLWIHGEDDVIISDQSYSDPGYQGKLELRPGWPGEQQYPPQPMCSQIEYVLGEYETRGGRVNRCEIADAGHSPFLEQPEHVLTAMRNHWK